MKLTDSFINEEIIKTYCSYCLASTIQVIRGKFAPTYKADYETFEHNEYCVAECLNCNRISFIHVQWDDNEESKDENGDQKKTVTFFIEDIQWFKDNEFLIDEDVDDLPAKIIEIYEELREALQTEMRLLAGIGMRMLIEAVCLNHKIPGKNLQEQIKGLFDLGHISRNDLQVLDEIRKIGNISAHKIKPPSDATFEAALQAVNHLLRSIYIIPKRTRRLRAKTKK